MKVVVNATPLIGLSLINRLDLLPALFEEIVVHLCQLKVECWERGHLGRSLRAGRPRSQRVKLTQMIVVPRVVYDEVILAAFRADLLSKTEALEAIRQWRE